MTQPAKVQEPSMEEILASIRRIIADDEAKPAAAEKPASPAAAAKPAVMKDIPPSAIAPAPKPARRAEAGPARHPAACTRTGRQQQPGRHRRDAGEPRCGDARGGHQAGAARAEPTCSNSPTRWRCLSRHRRRPTFSKVEPQDDIEFTEAKASRRQPAYEPPFESAAPARPILSHSTVSAVESAFNSLANTVLSNNARTLEDLVKEMLRPMLKSWLDDNLPGLVERIVKAEIERVSRGGR